MRRLFGGFLILAVVTGSFLTHSQHDRRVGRTKIRYASLSHNAHHISAHQADLRARHYLPAIWPRLHSIRTRLREVQTPHFDGPAWLITGTIPVTTAPSHVYTIVINAKTGRPITAVSVPRPSPAPLHSQNL